MTIRLIAALALLAAPALAQTPPAELGARYVPAPWWMREPVIASIGMVRTELPANRASFTAEFSTVARTATEATATVATRVRELDRELRALGADRLRLATVFETRPLYEQYREKDGSVQENERADKIERYEVTANLTIEVRDVGVLEQAYARVIAAQPSSVDRVIFSLEPDNQAKTWLQTEAVKDAARRARQAAEGADARLGAVKVIDPTGRACRTDVLAGWPSYAGASQRPTDVAYAAPSPPAPAMDQIVMATGSRKAAEPIQVTLQPPRQTLEDQACVVYGLL